jgi:hypothetical protein
MLSNLYWVFSFFTFFLWISVYLFQFYCRTKNPHNISYYLTLCWLQSNVLGLVCSLLTFKSFANVIIIEYIIYITFDIISVLQYLILLNRSENTSSIKRQLVATFICIVLVGIFTTVAVLYEASIVTITWYSILILVLSRIPQIKDYCRQSTLDKKPILFTLSAGIFADISFLVSISIDSYLKNDIFKFLPWISCTSLILVFDISSIVIVYFRKIE